MIQSKVSVVCVLTCFLPGNQGERLEVRFHNSIFQDIYKIYQAPEASGDKAIESFQNHQQTERRIEERF